MDQKNLYNLKHNKKIKINSLRDMSRKSILSIGAPEGEEKGQIFKNLKK